jgi:acyl-CoA thioesterase
MLRRVRSGHNLRSLSVRAYIVNDRQNMPVWRENFDCRRTSLLESHVWRDDKTLVATMDPEIAAYTGAFGGWVAAHALIAATRVVDDAEALPLSINVDFLRGVGPGELESQATVIHSTRSLRFVHVQSTQSADIAAATSATFARRRPTEAIESVTMPVCAAPESLAPAATQGMPVTWVKQFDLRFATGALGTRVPAMRSLTWVRLKSAPALSYPLLAAIADTPLPRIFLHFNTMSKISTVSMNAGIFADRDELVAVGTDYVLTEAWSQVARHGYYDQQTRIWSRHGKLLASSSQLVWYNVGASPNEPRATPE